MPKPRIIIADTDLNYITPLQMKFVGEYFEEINLETITNSDYFNQFFSVPQEIDILIIAESLYNSDLQLHNIKKIFLMTEQQEYKSFTARNLNIIFKYTSIKEIFNIIVGNSLDIFDFSEDVKKGTQIILICSASGGVGKTTIAFGLCGCLTKNYKRVLYINAEQLQSFQCRLENSSAILSADLYKKLVDGDENIYKEIKGAIRKEKFDYLPPFKAGLMSLGLKNDVFEKIALSVKEKNEYDYVVIDTDTVFNENKANLIGIADRVIIITNQSYASVFSTNILAENINELNNEKYIFICNAFDKEKENALISSQSNLKFVVNDYIDYIPCCEQKSIADIVNDGIKKIAFLMM